MNMKSAVVTVLGAIVGALICILFFKIVIILPNPDESLIPTWILVLLFGISGATIGAAFGYFFSKKG